MAKVIAVLGGGSVWTPHLLERLAELPLTMDLQLRIQGPTESHLQEVVAFTRRLIGDRFDIKVTVALQEAIADASIILNQARIGGWSARLNDEVFPVQLGMVGDESLGLGGLRAAIRTWPFIGVGWLMPPPDIPIDKIFKLCPDLTPWIQTWKAIPTPWRVHLSRPNALFLIQQRSPGRRARQLKKLAEHLRNLIRKQDAEEYRALLMKRFPVWHSEIVAPAMRGLLGGETARLIVGLPNKANLPDLDCDVQVEGWAVLKSGGIHPEAYPENARCQEDIIRFGQSRALAFSAMMNPASYSDGRHARSDAFTRFAPTEVDWQELLRV
jgi:alpha-galactosidase/6-phospho-beta-glucosidase family protein